MITTQANAIDLTPVNLKENIIQIGSDAIRAQGQSLVILRQVPLNILDDALNIADNTANHQKTVNSFVNYYLNSVMPKVIFCITNVSALSNMILALRTVKPTNNESLKDILKSIISQIENYKLSNADFIDRLKVFATNNTNELTTFKKEVDDLIKKLEGDDGAISKAKQAISETSDLLDTNIQEIIDNSNIIGDGVKDLVTYALTIITSSSSKSNTSEKDKDNSDKKDSEKQENFDPFPVESMGAVSNGVSGVSEAVAAYQKNLKALAGLYQDFAELNALLSALTAIEQQSAQYASMINSILTDSESYNDTINKISDNFESCIKELDSGNLTVSEFLSNFDNSVKYWTNLQDNVREIEAAMSGTGQLFPQVQSI